MFLGGCGRFFEGNATEMHSALIGKLSLLQNNTSVYCGHEYSLQNLSFGLHVEPDNLDISKKIEWAKKQREDNLPTVSKNNILTNRQNFKMTNMLRLNSPNRR